MRIAQHPLMLPIRPILRSGPLKTCLAAIVVIYGRRALGSLLLAAVAAGLWLVLVSTCGPCRRSAAGGFAVDGIDGRR